MYWFQLYCGGGDVHKGTRMSFEDNLNLLKATSTEYFVGAKRRVSNCTGARKRSDGMAWSPPPRAALTRQLSRAAGGC